MIAEIAGGIIPSLLAIGVGFMLGLQRRAAASLPLCTCGHIMLLHTEGLQATACSQRLRVPHFNEYGQRDGWHWVPCPCQAAVPVLAASAA